MAPKAPLCSHLSGRRVAAPLVAAYPGLAFPTKGKGAYGDEQPPVVHGRLRPCLALLPAGVTWPPALRQAPVVSYTTFSPSPPPPCLPQILRIWGRCPLGQRGWLSVSVALFRQVHASRRFPAPGTLRRRAL